MIVWAAHTTVVCLRLLCKQPHDCIFHWFGVPFPTGGVPYHAGCINSGTMLLIRRPGRARVPGSAIIVHVSADSRCWTNRGNGDTLCKTRPVGGRVKSKSRTPPIAFIRSLSQHMCTPARPPTGPPGEHFLFLSASAKCPVRAC